MLVAITGGSSLAWFAYQVIGRDAVFRVLGRDPSLAEIKGELKNLRTNSSSALFHGYGWELIIGDEIYEKN